MCLNLMSVRPLPCSSRAWELMKSGGSKDGGRIHMLKSRNWISSSEKETQIPKAVECIHLCRLSSHFFIELRPNLEPLGNIMCFNSRKNIPAWYIDSDNCIF